MDGWDFGAWRTALAALPPRQAALVGLAAAERLAGCLRDERFGRYPGPARGLVGDLLDRCWTAVAGAGPEIAPSPEIRELAGRVEAYTTEYVQLSMTDLFHSYGPFDDDPDGDSDGDPPDLEEFLEEAETEGAVGLHLDALVAVSEAALACSGGAWDGALRCLQTAAMAANALRVGTDREVERQERDLEMVRGREAGDVRDLAEALRGRAGAEADDWRRATERLALHHD